MDSTLRYEPGALILICGRETFVLADDTTAANGAVDELVRAAVSSNPNVLVDALLGAIGAGNLSDAALITVTADSRYRVIVSGGLTAEVGDASGVLRIEAKQGQVHDTALAAAHQIALQPRGMASLAAGRRLDLLVGAVRAARLRLDCGMPNRSPDTRGGPESRATGALRGRKSPLLDDGITTPQARLLDRAAVTLIDLTTRVTPGQPLPTESRGAELPSLNAPVLVKGIPCPVDHLNHPKAVFCLLCGRRLRTNKTVVTIEGPRPPLGLLIADDGLTFRLATDVIIGRDPTVHPTVKARSADAWSLPDPSSELSRAHVAIYLREWYVFAQDLDTPNGTGLRRNGAPVAERLDSTNSTQLGAGDSLLVGQRELRLELHHVRAA